MSDFKNITDLLIKFRDERDWEQVKKKKDYFIRMRQGAIIDVIIEKQYLHSKTYALNGLTRENASK